MSVESIEILRLRGLRSGKEIDPRPSLISDYLHTRSVQRWKSDPWFGFQLAPEVRELAIRLGYTPEELDNHSRRLWPVSRQLTRALYKAATPARKLARALLRRVRPTAST